MQDEIKNKDERASGKIIGKSLRVFDLKMPLRRRIFWFWAATWLIVAVGKFNQLVEAKLGEKFLSQFLPYLFAFGIFEVIVVFSIFFYLCHLTFSTTGIDFEKAENRYTVWLRICGIRISKESKNVPTDAKVYVQKTKKFFGLHIYAIRIGQHGPLIISRLDRDNCVATAGQIADYLGLEVQEI